MTRDEIFAQLDRSWANLNAAIEGLPLARWSEAGVCGDWSVKDVLGHIAFWDRQGGEMRTREAAGEPPTKLDWQAMNDADAAAKADWTAAQIETELTAAHAAMLTAYHALPNLDADEIKEDWDHYDEHAAEIRASRVREKV